MRFIHFLVLVALTLVASCSTFTSAEDSTQIKSLTTDLQREIPKEDRRHIKGSLRTADSTAAEEERNANVPQAVVAKSNLAKALEKFTRKLWDSAFLKRIRAAMSKAYKKMGEYGTAAFQKLGVISKNAKKSDAGKTLATTEAKADPTSGEVGSKALKTLDTAVEKAESTSGTAGTTTLKNLDAVESLGTLKTTALKNSDAVESLGTVKTTTLKNSDAVESLGTVKTTTLKNSDAVESLGTDETTALKNSDAVESLGKVKTTALKNSDAVESLGTVKTTALKNSDAVESLGTVKTTALKNSDAVESLGTEETTALKNLDAVESLGATKTKVDPIVRDVETKANNAFEGKKADTTEAKVPPTFDATDSQSHITPLKNGEKTNAIWTAVRLKPKKILEGAYNMGKAVTSTVGETAGLAMKKLSRANAVVGQLKKKSEAKVAVDTVGLVPESAWNYAWRNQHRSRA